MCQKRAFVSREVVKKNSMKNDITNFNVITGWLTRLLWKNNLLLLLKNNVKIEMERKVEKVNQLSAGKFSSLFLRSKKSYNYF